MIGWIVLGVFCVCGACAAILVLACAVAGARADAKFPEHYNAGGDDD